MVYASIFQWENIRLYLIADKYALLGIGFKDLGEAVWKENAILLKCKKQLQEYFLGQRKVFDIPICFEGTEFQNAVWKKLIDIPYGQVMSYSELAVEKGNPKAARAVGSACNKNPIAIIIPCHRVVGKSGSLNGYAGGITIKESLLELEKEGLK